MGACEIRSDDHARRETSQRPPHTPTPQETVPRFPSSAAACRHQARSSWPAPAGAALRALQLDPGPARRHNRQRRGKATTKVPSQPRRPSEQVIGSTQYALLTTGALMGAVTSALDAERRRITIGRQSGGGPLRLPRQCRPGPGGHRQAWERAVAAGKGAHSEPCRVPCGQRITSLEGLRVSWTRHLARKLFVIQGYGPAGELPLGRV